MIDWESHAISLLITGPIFAFGFMASKYNLMWALGAVAWHFLSGIAVSIYYDAQEAEEDGQ